MDKRKYIGAGIGIRSMNRILTVLAAEPLPVMLVSARADICFDSAAKYLRRLVDMGKLTVERRNKLKIYTRLPGAELLEEVQPLYIDRHAPKPKKKAGRPRTRPEQPPKPKAPGAPWSRTNSVTQPKRIQAKAQQIGIARHPMDVMLFGPTQRASA